MGALNLAITYANRIVKAYYEARDSGDASKLVFLGSLAVGTVMLYLGFTRR